MNALHADLRRARRGSSVWVLLLGLWAGLASVTADAERAPAVASVAATSPKNDYSSAENWLCRPGRKDACAIDQTTSIIAARGTVTKELWVADPSAPIDCFYVYPTVSFDQTGNSDMTPGPEELGVIQAQAARFGSKCRVFAPMYRQITLAALRAFMTGKPMAADRGLAYADVLDAWNYYLQHDNNGRGVVLIGHSQGSGVLSQLLAHEIDGKPIQTQLISALLLGTSFSVPPGKDVGGDLQHIPLCHAPDQIGCVVTFASFRANAPPPANSRFGKGRSPGMSSSCTNPAALGGGSGELHAYFVAAGRGVADAGTPMNRWLSTGGPIETPFVSLPGMLTAECVTNEHGVYLAVTVHGDPSDPRADDIPGDIVVNGNVLSDWGLHLIDVNLVMGNLLDVVAAQTKTYLEVHHRH